MYFNHFTILIVFLLHRYLNKITIIIFIFIFYHYYLLLLFYLSLSCGFTFDQNKCDRKWNARISIHSVSLAIKQQVVSTFSWCANRGGNCFRLQALTVYLITNTMDVTENKLSAWVRTELPADVNANGNEKKRRKSAVFWPKYDIRPYIL